MYLKDLIAALEKEDPDKRVARGFDHAHSYRGIYADVAFEPCGETTVGAMLAEAKYALGQTFTGWKGGEFTMGEYTECHLARQGETGEELGPTLLWYMLQPLNFGETDE